MKVGVHANPHKPAAFELARRALGMIGDRAEVVLSEEVGSLEPGRPHAPWEKLAPDILIAIGGDGTFLHALRRCPAPLLPINAGTLGVLAEVDAQLPGELETTIDRLLGGRFFLEERAKLAAEAGTTLLPDATNEYLIHAPQVGKMGTFEISFDRVPVGTIRADGLIVATPTGSTGYALSTGGPIVFPTLGVMVLAPICPHTLSARPVVLPDSFEMEVRIRTQDHDAMLTLDGQESTQLANQDTVRIRKGRSAVALVRSAHPYFEIWRDKLRWG